MSAAHELERRSRGRASRQAQIRRKTGVQRAAGEPSPRATAAMRPCHLPPAFILLAAAWLPFSASVPPYIKNFWEAIDVAKAGLVPGEWNPDLVSPPPPPGAAPPPWWARGVGGDKYYDWNKREQGWEALISAGDVQPAVRPLQR